jgi:glucose-1-phosphate cytidylyltransferase
VDTGSQSNVGQRLSAVRKHLEGDEMFLANYADGLSDLPLQGYVEDVKASGVVAAFLGVRPSQSFHTVRVGEQELVERIEHVRATDVWINGGFFALRTEIFQYLRAGEELVERPFERLIAERRLMARRYDGFWASMDTFKDKKMFDDMHERGKRPWEVWNNHQTT